MARIAGVEIPNEKKAKVSITYIFGIGKSLAQDILQSANVDGEKRVHDLSEAELSRLRSVIEENYQVEGALRQEITENIRRLKNIKCYRGVRHQLGLPVRGQKTQYNARTRKGRRGQAVGGLKLKVTKK